VITPARASYATTLNEMVNEMRKGCVFMSGVARALTRISRAILASFRLLPRPGGALYINRIDNVR
jgi:hypothetical protein